MEAMKEARKDGWKEGMINRRMKGTLARQKRIAWEERRK